MSAIPLGNYFIPNFFYKLRITDLTIVYFIVKSASFILLQKAPSGIPIDDVRSKIKEVRCKNF
jgi:hypothetical protein